jgi:hypothetical protein
MAQSYETGNSAVTADKPITDLLSAPLSPGWTIDGLADQLLAAIAAQPKAQDLILDAEAAADRQSRRLIRPLLACLATKSGAENGTPVNLYGGESPFSGGVLKDQSGFSAASRTSQAACGPPSDDPPFRLRNPMEVHHR